jgi:DNA helicase-2/ATP-dependent DNA helicase PcrA
LAAGRKEGMQDLKRELNDSQYEAVTTTEGPVLVVAGAGSGKTRVIEYRSLHLVRGDIEPESILLLTFTRRSAREMIDRAARNDLRCSRIDGGTFHSFASRILRRYNNNLGLSNSFTIYDEGDAEEAIRRCCNKMGYDQDKEFPKKNELKNVFSLCVNKGLNVDDAVSKTYRDYEDWLGEIRTVQEEYARYKLRNNSVDYDDLLVYLKVVLENDEIRERLSAQYRYIMVDEFQDTNRVQADIVHLLAKKNGNVMAVGDDAQSIYGFRGANYLNILEFPGRFAGCKVIKLEENYRSTQSILNVGNAILNTMSHKFEKQLVSATGATGEKPVLRGFDDAYDEADWVAQKVISMLATGTPLGDMAVLFRTTFTSMPLQAELVKRGIRFKLFGGKKFYETAHVRDVVSYLRLVANPTDELAWQRVLLLLPGIGTRTVERFLELITGYDTLRDIIDKVITPVCTGQKHSDVFASLKGLLDTITGARVAPSASEAATRCAGARAKGAALSPARQLEHVIAHYSPIMKAKYKKDSARVKELVMLQHMAQRYATLKDFLADVAVDPDKDAQDGDLEFLTLSTVHSAKGLEWSRVFLIGLVDGVFPSGRSLIDSGEGDVEEEKRLLYVAVTRARDELFMSSFARNGAGERSGSRLCRFLEAKNVRKTFEEEARKSTSTSGRSRSRGARYPRR